MFNLTSTILLTLLITIMVVGNLFSVVKFMVFPVRGLTRNTTEASGRCMTQV